MGVMIQRLRNSATGPWLLVGLIITNLAASIPFGISDTSPGSPPNTFEWTATIAFIVSVIAFLISVWFLQARVFAAVLSGALWFGTAVGSILAYRGHLDLQTLTAYFLIPLGLSIISFGLARVAQVERLGEAERLERAV